PPAQPPAARLGEAACRALVLDHPGVLARRGRIGEAEDLYRIPRRRLLDLLAAEVVERPHLPPCVTRDDRVADAERAPVDEHRRRGSAADVQARLEDGRRS